MPVAESNTIRIHGIELTITFKGGTEMKRPSAFALFSGGPDSTTLAYWLQSKEIVFDALYINYGHPNAKAELKAARSLCKKLRVKLHIVNMLGPYQSFLDGTGSSPRDVLRMAGCNDPWLNS